MHFLYSGTLIQHNTEARTPCSLKPEGHRHSPAARLARSHTARAAGVCAAGKLLLEHGFGIAVRMQQCQKYSECLLSKALCKLWGQNHFLFGAGTNFHFTFVQYWYNKAPRELVQCKVIIICVNKLAACLEAACISLET